MAHPFDRRMLLRCGWFAIARKCRRLGGTDVKRGTVCDMDAIPKRSPTLPPLLIEHRDELLAIAERNGLCNVRVFGSMARGEASQDSDVDFLVDTKPGTTGLGLGGMLVDAEELLQRHVDVVTVGFLYPLMRERVLKEAVPL